MTTNWLAATEPSRDHRGGPERPPTSSAAGSEQTGETVAAIRDEAAAVKRRELEEALSKLDASGEVTDEQRAAVEAAADAIAERLVAVPVRSLEGECDPETLRAAHRLFGTDGADPLADGAETNGEGTDGDESGGDEVDATGGGPR